MKILQIINSLGTGGAEKLLLDTIPLYRQKGIEMDILLLWNNNHQFTQTLMDMNVCKVHILSESQNVRDIYNPMHILKMRSVMKNYAVVHVHLFPAQYFTVIANRLNGRSSKLVFTEHNTSNNRISSRFLKIIDRLFYKDYSKLVCISEEIRQIYLDYLGSPEKLALIPNGIDVEKYNSAAAADRKKIHQDISVGDKIIIQVSAFRPQKDQDTVIKSLTHLPEAFKLVLVGDGERKNLLVELVEKLSLQHRVFFLGQRMDIPQLLKASDAVVLSSHYEGLSLASVEGMASGRPFVASDVPGLHDVVAGAGVLFPQGDSEQLAAILSRLITDREYAAEVSDKCYQRAREFGIEKLISRHIDLYNQLQ